MAALVLSSLALSAGALAACATVPSVQPSPPTAGTTGATGQPEAAPPAETRSSADAAEAPQSPGSTGPESSGETGSTGPTADAGLHPEVSDLTLRWSGARTRAGESVTLVGEAPDEVMRRVVAAGDEAWRRCRQRWPESVPQGVLVLPADEAQAQAAARDEADVPPARSGGTAALNGPAATTVVVGAPGQARARVHLASAAPAALTEEGLRVVLTHECAHVALAARARPDAPRWLVEGVAEHVAYDTSTVDRALVLAPYLDDRRRRHALPQLPTDEAFEGSGTPSQAAPDPTRSYAAALSAADSYARHEGEDALLRLVTDGTSRGRRDRAAYAAIEAILVPLWRRDLAEMADQP